MRQNIATCICTHAPISIIIGIRVIGAKILLSLFCVKRKEVSAGLVVMPGTQLRKQGTARVMDRSPLPACHSIVSEVISPSDISYFFSTIDAHLALELLERYRNKLNDPGDQNLRDSITRAINAIRSRLFQALIGKWARVIILIHFANKFNWYALLGNKYVGTF